MSITGLHHITAIAGDARTNLEFYTGVLGLRLVKKTINYDDPETYHFYYGERTLNLLEKLNYQIVGTEGNITRLTPKTGFGNIDVRATGQFLGGKAALAQFTMLRFVYLMMQRKQKQESSSCSRVFKQRKYKTGSISARFIFVSQAVYCLKLLQIVQVLAPMKTLNI
jgi:catechol 2,3-dioxygenase-like lactoylglutathione lyase family enzyme